MQKNHQLYRQTIEYYFALKLYLALQNHPKKKIIEIKLIDIPEFITLLDSVVFTQKSSLSQILPTNSVSIALTLEKREPILTITNNEIYSLDSYSSLITYIQKKLNNSISPDQVNNHLSLVFPNDETIKQNLENNLKSYLVKIVDNKLHQTNSCTFEYQVERIRNTITTLSRSINLNNLKLDQDDVFKDCECSSHFIEVIGAICLSGAFDINSLSFTKNSNNYIANIDIESPDKIDINTIREYFSLNPKQDIKTHFEGNNTYKYENKHLVLLLGDGGEDMIDFGNSVSGRFVFETFLELRRTAPLDKKVFTYPEISEKYAEMHKGAVQSEWEYKTLEPGYISKVVGHCKQVMFKGKNKVYRQRFDWEYDYGGKGYRFEIK